MQKVKVNCEVIHTSLTIVAIAITKFKANCSLNFYIIK